MEEVKNEDREDQLDACRMVLRILMSSRHGPRNQYFLHPVDTVALNVPHYFTIVRHPMDLGTIKAKLENNLYNGARDFEKDVRLMFENCYKFNPEGHEVTKAGYELEESTASLDDINFQPENPDIAAAVMQGSAAGDNPMQDLEQHGPEPKYSPSRVHRRGASPAISAAFSRPKSRSRMNNLARTLESSNSGMSPPKRLRMEEFIPPNPKKEPKSSEDPIDDLLVTESPHSAEGFEKGTYAVFDAGVAKLLGIVTNTVTKLRRSCAEEDHTCCKFQLVNHLGTIEKTMILDLEDVTKTRHQKGDRIPMGINVCKQEMHIEVEVLAIKMVDGVVLYEVKVHDQTITVPRMTWTELDYATRAWT